MSNLAAWKKTKFESVFLFAFLNIAIIIFCLIYSLNIPHSNQNLSFFINWTEVSVSIINLFSTFRRLVGQWHENNFYISFRVTLPLSREIDLCLDLRINTKYVVCLSFPGSQAKSSWVSKVYLLLWKSQ